MEKCGLAQYPASADVALQVVGFAGGGDTYAGAAGVDEGEVARLVVHLCHDAHMTDVTAHARAAEEHQVPLAQLPAVVDLCPFQELGTGGAGQ